MSADGIRNELIWNAIQAITDEMSNVLYRSSFSPIIREMLDFSCSILSPEGRILADSGHTPAQVGTLELALQGLLERHGALAPGDIAVTNDPYGGATHLDDIEIFMPVYSGERLIAYTASVAHHMDIGGMSAHNSGTRIEGHPLVIDVYEEGFQFGGVKIYERGVRNDAVWNVFLANVRDPDSSIGDFSAQMSGCNRGALRLVELGERFGVDVLLDAMQELLSDTARRAAAAIASWPQRSVRIEHDLDGDGLNYETRVRIVATVTVEDGQIFVDFEGTAPQVSGPMNVPLASTYAAVYYGLRCFMGEHVRNNSGYMQQISIAAPLGCLTNPVKPAPVKMRHRVVQAIADMMYRAMGELLPERAVGSSHVSYPLIHMTAYDPRKSVQRSMMDMIGGGGGAREGSHGDDAIDSYTSNCALLSAEVIEVEYPWRIVRSELVHGSEGDGRWRGGRGLRREYELLGETASGRVTLDQQLGAGPSGAHGGGEGATSSTHIKRVGHDWERVPQGTNAIALRRGDIVAVVGAGGGGYGEGTA